MTIQRILCAVEMRLDDIGVLNSACLIARPFRARIDTLLLRDGHEPPTARRSSTERPREIDPSREAELLFAELLGSTPGAPIVDHVASGDARAILERSERCGADLIVLASRPPLVDSGQEAGGLEPFGAARCPIMTVPTTARPASISRILLPVDFSSATGRAVEWAAMLAQRFSATVHLMHAVGSAALRSATVRRGLSIQPDVGRAEAGLSHISQQLGAAGVHCDSSIAEQGTSHAIIGCRSREMCDLIVMGAHHRHTHGRPAAARPEAQSMVATIRSRASVPVLSVAAPGTGDCCEFNEPPDKVVFNPWRTSHVDQAFARAYVS